MLHARNNTILFLWEKIFILMQNIFIVPGMQHGHRAKPLYPTATTTLLCGECSGTVNDCFPLLPVFHELREFTTPSGRISCKDVDIVLCWSIPTAVTVATKSQLTVPRRLSTVLLFVSLSKCILPCL